MSEEEEIRKERINRLVMGIQSFSATGADVPLYTEESNIGGWIDYGSNNDLPSYYVGLMARSPKHNAILKGKALMIGGNGIDKDGLSDDALKFIRNAMNEYDMEEIVARISYDLEVFGAFALNIVWSKDRKTIGQVGYINPQTLRIADPNPAKPDEENYLICADWDNQNNNEIVKYQGFSTVNRSEASQILYVKEYRPGRYFYGEPEYMSCARWIEMEYEISHFHLNNLKNGFAPSMIINFINDIPTDEEMDLLMARTDKEYKGAQGAGKVIYTFSKDKDSAPIYTPISPNNSDERFIQLNKEIEQGIYTGHRVTNPAIFGSSQEGSVQFGQSDLLNSLEMFNSMYVKPKQQIIEKALNRLARINGVNEKLELTEYRIQFSKMDLTVSDVLSIIQAPISGKQKFELLTSNGYDELTATKLVGDVNAPAPVEPPKDGGTPKENKPI